MMELYPILSRRNERAGENYRMEGDIVFSDELKQLDVVLLKPPVFPIGTG